MGVFVKRSIMPRPSRESTLGVDQHLADVISRWLHRHKWSYYKLAAAMKREGCDIAESSLRQSVVPRLNSKGEPHLRAFTVDQLIALSRVFGLPVDRLLKGRDWVDDEQVQEALQGLNRANNLLVAAVRDTFDAEVALIRASETVSDEIQRRVVDEPNVKWRASLRGMRIKPKAARDDSPGLSSEAVADILSDLKGTIAAMALDWCERDDDERTLQRNDLPVPDRPMVGSRPWRSQLSLTMDHHSDPEEWAPEEYLGSRDTAKRMLAQEPKTE